MKVLVNLLDWDHQRIPCHEMIVTGECHGHTFSLTEGDVERTFQVQLHRKF